MDIVGYSATIASENEEPRGGGMTNKQRQELYAAVNYEEGDEVAAGLVPPWDIMKAQVLLSFTGSLSLCGGSAAEQGVISVIFDDINADVTQRLMKTLTSPSSSAECTYAMARRLAIYSDIVRMKNSTS